MPGLFDRSSMRASLRQSVAPAGSPGATALSPRQQEALNRKQTRIARLQEQRKKEENLANYRAEVAAEEAGEKPKQSENSVVRMIEHGVAAQAEEQRANHKATALGGAQKSSLAGSAQSKKAPAAPPPILKDIMF